MAESPIHHVSDTAFWVAVYRAQETERKNALFRDPLAARLVEGRGRDIARRMKGSAAVAWNVRMRTVVIDAYIQEAIAAGIDTILNLGAGLDTRPYRMDLPATLRWIEVDFADTIAFKEERLAGETPRCQLRRVGLDLADPDARRALFAEIGNEAERVLVLTEGVVPYLSLEHAGALAADLHAQPAFVYWVLDRFSKAMLSRRDRTRLGKKMERAPFQFRPDDWEAFFAQYGWRVKAMKSLAAEARKLGRGTPPGWYGLMIRLFWRSMSEAKRREIDEVVSYALLERV